MAGEARPGFWFKFQNRSQYGTRLPAMVETQNIDDQLSVLKLIQSVTKKFLKHQQQGRCGRVFELLL